MLVMELLPYPNLEDAHREQPLLMDHTKELLSELLSGLVYLHDKHVTHRDLKPANIILVSREPIRIKMTDFGLAVERSDQLTSHCGSLPYLAPEVHGKSYTNKVDMWSVGVIALELAEGLPDYPGGRHRDWPGLLQGKLNAAPLDPQFHGFVKSLLRSHADRRPSAHQSLQDRGLQIESHFLDAAGSPTEYAPTPSEYRAQYTSSSGPPQSSVFASRHRSANAPSPSDKAADQTQIFAPLPDNPFSQAPAPVPVQPPLSVHTVPARGQAPATIYWKLKYAGATVMYRPEDGLVNATHLLRAIGQKRVRWSSLEKKLENIYRISVYGNPIAGTYVSITDAREILRYLQASTASLQELTRQITEQK